MGRYDDPSRGEGSGGWRPRPQLAWAAAMLALTLAALAPRGAAAQDKEAEANKLFVEARERLAQKQPEEALELLDRAEKLFQHPAILLLKAKTQREVGRLDDADATLGRVPASKLPKPLKKVHDDETAEIVRLKGLHGRVVVNVQPAEAFVVIDGAQYRGGYDRWRPPGEVRVEALAAGHQPAVRTVTVAVGARVDLELVLQPLRGHVRVTVPGGLRGVEVLVDDKPQPIDDARRAGEVAQFSLDLGRHTIVCQRGDKREAHTVDVALGQTHPLRCEAVGGAGGGALRATIGWSGVAVGAGLAGYGAWGIASYFSDLELAEQTGRIADSNKHYGGALYLASGLAVGVASWLLFVREPAAEEASAALGAPSAGSGPFVAQ